MASQTSPYSTEGSLQTLLRKIPTGINVWKDRFGNYHLLMPDLVPKVEGLRLIAAVKNPKEGGS